jgi:hypothetical protein
LAEVLLPSREGLHAVKHAAIVSVSDLGNQGTEKNLGHVFLEEIVSAMAAIVIALFTFSRKQIEDAGDGQGKKATSRSEELELTG